MFGHLTILYMNRLINFFWFSDTFCACHLLLKFACIFVVLSIYFELISTCLPLTLSIRKADFFKRILESFFSTLSFSEDRWTLGSTFSHSLKIFNFHLSLKTLRLSWHFSLGIAKKLSTRKRFVQQLTLCKIDSLS